MSRIASIWGAWPPVLRALAAQGLTFLALLVIAWIFPKPPSIWPWVILQGTLAALLTAHWGLGRWWQAFQMLLPLGLAWQLGHPVPGWIFLALLAILLLVFGGGILTRVPLYNSNREAWEHLLDLIPEAEALKVADLGAGLGGPLAHLASRRPLAQFVGVEASLLVWLTAWLRTIPNRRNCSLRLGSLWHLPLGEFHLVYAFLSPAPMAALWEKARREMKSGALLVSHSFEVPELEPERRIPLTGLPGACLLLYRIPDSSPDSR